MGKKSTTPAGGRTLKWSTQHQKALSTDSNPNSLVVKFIDESLNNRSFNAPIPNASSRYFTDFKATISNMLKEAYLKGRKDLKKDIQEESKKIRAVLGIDIDYTNLL